MLYTIIILAIVGVIAYPKVKPVLFSAETTEGGNPSGKGSGGRGSSRSLNVNGIVIKPQELVDKIVRTGTLTADEEVDLSFETSGKIVAINFTEGSQVKKGQLLAKVNDSPLQAQLLKLEAQKRLSEERLYRQKSLLEKDAVSIEAYNQASTDVETLNADIALIKSRIAETELKAPFDGVIGLRYVSEGAYTTTSTKIARLTKLSPIKIDFTIPSRYASVVKKNSTVNFLVDGKIDKYVATVYAVDSKVDPSTNSLPVRATYPNSNHELVAGMYASVELVLNKVNDAITIPSEALVSEMGINKVYLYKGGKAISVEVITGLRSSSTMQILRGLSVGDTLIASGILQLRNGMSVTLDNVE